MGTKKINILLFLVLFYATVLFGCKKSDISEPSGSISSNITVSETESQISTQTPSTTVSQTSSQNSSNQKSNSSTANLLSKWELSGEAKIVSNVLVCLKSSRATYTDENLTDSLILECDISASSSTKSGIILNGTSEADYFLFSLNTSSDKAEVTHYTDGNAESVTSAYFDLDKKGTYHLKLIVTDYYLRAYVSKSGSKAPAYPLIDVRMRNDYPNSISIFAKDCDLTLKNIKISEDSSEDYDTYTNPVTTGADPYVLFHNGTYYMYCTNAVLEGYKVYTSTNLVDWTDNGPCLQASNVYGTPTDTGGFWAPEVYHYKNKFYMLYTVQEHLGIAVSDSPLGPFKSPKQSFLSENKEIDGHLFFDDDGKVYIYFLYAQVPLMADLLEMKFSVLSSI